jgi:hypothetical protein
VILVLSLGSKLCGKRTSVGLDIDQRKLCIRANRQRERQRPVLTGPDGLFQVAHEVARKVKRARDTAVANVLLDLSLAIKVRHMGQATSADFGDAQERGEDEVLYANFLGYIGDVLALADFGRGVSCLPVVCHEENSVGIFESGLQTVL